MRDCSLMKPKYEVVHAKNAGIFPIYVVLITKYLACQTFRCRKKKYLKKITDAFKLIYLKTIKKKLFE